MMAAFLMSSAATGYFNLSNTLGDGMVLQREPQAAVVWGFGDAGVNISTTFDGKDLGAMVGTDGIWRISLPPTPASKEGTTLTFHGSEGTTITLNSVLFGDVYLCSGQSNMQYTPRSMAGMNNMSSELAAADAYAASMRFFTVGMDTQCGDPKKNQTDCTKVSACARHAHAHVTCANAHGRTTMDGLRVTLVHPRVRGSPSGSSTRTFRPTPITPAAAATRAARRGSRRAPLLSAAPHGTASARCAG